ncbi:PTS transporter subunit EIIB [Streptomyces prasinus]|uniref:PTS transporter subunit EIIB n=1 Tax=Streptomyces prasinus TaxID=67345 RepID=UPI0036804853
MPAHDDNQATAAILRGVGGQENVARLPHCFVRLRFRLRDPATADMSPIAAWRRWLSNRSTSPGLRPGVPPTAVASSPRLRDPSRGRNPQPVVRRAEVSR